MPGIASAGDRRSSSATSPAATTTIRVGAGGIMLPNHAPLTIAEQFGTLAALLSRPHRPRPRPRAGRRHGDGPRAPPRHGPGRTRFPAGRGRAARATSARRRPAARSAPSPATGTEVPRLDPRLQPLRRAARRLLSACPTPSPRTSPPPRSSRRSRSTGATFQPSQWLDRPRFMLARQRLRRRHRRRRRAGCAPRCSRPSSTSAPAARASSRAPVDDIEQVLDARHADGRQRSALACLRRRLASDRPRGNSPTSSTATAPDELILTGQIHDHAARLRSFEIAAEAMADIARKAAA